MTGKELMKKCETLGWYLDRVKGSHYIMLHPDKPDSLPIPIHSGKELGKGILHKLMKKAGLK